MESTRRTNYQLGLRSIFCTTDHQSPRRLAARLGHRWSAWLAGPSKGLSCHDRVLRCGQDWGVRYVEQGAVQKIRATTNNLCRGLMDIRAIRCIGVTPKQQTFLIVAHGGRRGFRRSKKVFANPFEDTYYIAVACGSVQVHEQFRQPWERLFGKASLPILDSFEPVWPQPGWGACEFEAWLSENSGIWGRIGNLDLHCKNQKPSTPNPAKSTSPIRWAETDHSTWFSRLEQSPTWT